MEADSYAGGKIALPPNGVWDLGASTLEGPVLEWSPPFTVRVLSPMTLAMVSTLTDQETLTVSVELDGVEQDSVGIPGDGGTGTGWVNNPLTPFTVDNLEELTLHVAHDAGTSEVVQLRALLAVRQEGGS